MIGEYVARKVRVLNEMQLNLNGMQLSVRAVNVYGNREHVTRRIRKD